LTAARLGRKVGVSESTVVRFAVMLGYHGYPELQRTLQEMLKNKLTTVDRVLGSTQSFEETESLFYQIMQQDMRNIGLTIGENPPESLQQAVDMIIGADRVFVIGSRSAFSVAFFLSFNLQWILHNVTLLGLGLTDSFEQLVSIGPRDLAIGMTVTRYTRETVRAFQYCKERGAQTLAITDTLMSPIAQPADLTLQVKTSISSYVDSFVAPLSLANALLTAVSLARKQDTADALKEMEDLWTQLDVYYRGRNRD